MDSSWFHGGYATVNTASGNNGFMCGYAASCTPAELQNKEEEAEEELFMSSQIQHHLNQISMHMNMDDEVAPVYDGALDIEQHPIVEVDSLLDPHHVSSFPSSSSSSSLSLRSASLSCSPENSAQIFGSGALQTATATGGQYPEVSSHVPLPPAVPYDHQYNINIHVPTQATMAPELLPAAAKKTDGSFKSFTRHLGPRTQPKPGACGQRMFKTALSVLSKMHVAASARYNQQQYYYQASAAAEAAAPPPPSVNQLQHMISERKRREKLNDSFHALRAVLPPGAKKDKTSILIRAREYIRSLEAKASELEEKNKSLESRLAQRGSCGDGRKCAAGNDDDSGDKVHIEIIRAAKEECWAAIEPCDVRTLKIAVRSRCNMTEVMLRTMQCLKDQVGDDVTLVSMNTSGGGAEPQTSSSPGTVLTMQIKSSLGANWEEQQVKDAVAKVVADVLMLQSSAVNMAAPRRH